MEKTKKWNKIDTQTYALVQDEITLAKLIKKNSKNAAIELNNKSYTLKIKSAIFFSSMEIIDEYNETVVTMNPKKWYSTTFTITFNKELYELKIRNNPLAEYVLVQNNLECLAYGITTNSSTNKLAIKIEEPNQNQSPLLHAILWYLLEPIAKENFGDNLWWIGL